TVGPDGSIWFATINGIGRLAPGGQVTYFPLSWPPPSATHRPLGPIGVLKPGPDGNVWFTYYSYGSVLGIGRITPQGAITTFPFGPAQITGTSEYYGSFTVGRDGNLWFIDSQSVADVYSGFSSQVIVRMTPQGGVTFFPLPSLQGGALGSVL